MSDTCIVCGQPLEAHHLIVRGGVAHAAIYDSAGRSKSCSEQEAERLYFQARIQELTTFVRSLRWHAGRLRTKGRCWDCYELGSYASKNAAKIGQLEAMVQEYYAWAGER